MNPKLCPACSTPIPATAPGGFCPACLLRDTAEPAPTGRSGPSLAEVAAAFPALEILALIGRGGMGSVYQARQPSLDRLVALQLLAPELSGDPAFAGRFAREARTLEFGDGTQTKASPEPSASATSLSDPDLVFKSEP